MSFNDSKYSVQLTIKTPFLPLRACLFRLSVKHILELFLRVPEVELLEYFLLFTAFSGFFA